MLISKKKKMVGNLILKLYINIKYQYIAQEIVVTQLLEFWLKYVGIGNEL